MVLEGQFLERPALVACGELTLEGLAHRGRRGPALLVCPPLEGGGMDAPAVAELAWASARAGHPSLRFQHRGVGASHGAPDPACAVEDAEAALRHLAAGGPGLVAVAGVGSGCSTALGLLARARPVLSGLALVAPPAGLSFAGGRRKGPLTPLLVILPEGAPAPRRGALPAGAVVERMAGLDAGFRRGLPAVGHAVAAWLGGLG